MTTETNKPAPVTAIGAAAAGDEKPASTTVESKDPKVEAKPGTTETPKVDDAAAKAQVEKVAAEKAAAEADAAPFTDVAQLKLAEGRKLDDAVAKDFLAAAKDLGLNAKQARGLLGFNAKLAEAAETARVEKNAAADKAAHEALKADKEIGGAKFTESMALAGKAIRNVLGVEFGKWAAGLELADGTLLGNRVEFARALVNLGKKVAEDSKAGTHSNGAAKTVSPQRALEVALYGTDTPLKLSP